MEESIKGDEHYFSLPVAVRPEIDRKKEEEEEEGDRDQRKTMMNDVEEQTLVQRRVPGRESRGRIHRLVLLGLGTSSALINDHYKMDQLIWKSPCACCT